MHEIRSLTWNCHVVSVTDGDTVRLALHRTEIIPVSNDFEQVIVTQSHGPKGVPVRLIILDTPERGQVGYYEAKADLTAWLVEHEMQLMVETYVSAGWDRLLGDIYTVGDRGNTATQYMLLKGWEPYIK